VGGQFVKHIVPAIVKPAHALWNEVIGFLFLSLGVIFGAGAVRHGLRGNVFQAVVIGAVTIVMIYYGVSSFRRARKISRS
jgi:hypothetical protein